MQARKMLFGIVAVMVFSTLPLLAQNANWSIQSADWGSGSRRQDVTSTVRQLLNGGDFKANNKNLGVDPAPGRGKTLRIIARDRNGNVKNFKYNEGETVNTSRFIRNDYAGDWSNGRPSPRGLRIAKAEYGDVNGRYRVDVTQRLQGMVQNHRLDITVNNSTMGVDPAPRQAKQLYVTYTRNGRAYNTTVPENGQLRIP
jgi:DnaJ-like protein